MHIDDIKRGLRAEIKKREKEQYSTFQTNIREMCKDVLDKLEEQESRIQEMKEAAADIGLKWHDYDAGEDAWEDTHKGKWVKRNNKMTDKEQQLLDLFEKHKKDLDGGRLEALFEFTEDCEKELKQSPKYGKITTAIMHSYIRSAYQVGRKRAEDYYKALRKDEEERRFHLTCEETPPDGELVYCVGQDHCTKKELSGIYFYHSGYWWTDEQRKSNECWFDGSGINDYVFYKWMKLPKE